MLLTTKHFGKIEVDESRKIHFPHGVPGFPENKDYIILDDEENPESVYCWLQSVDDGDVALVLIDTFRIMPSYNPLVNQEEIEELGEVDISDLIVFNVAVISKDIAKSTVNLKAPIVINERTLLAKQIIVNNDEYEIRHNLVKFLKSGGDI